MGSEDNNAWACSVCTYKNRPEAFKCQICDTRKGTSTRKPRVTATIVAQQIISSFPPIPPPGPGSNSKYHRTNSGGKRSKKSIQAMSKLKDVDRDNGRDIQVTVNDLTITITDYKLLPPSSEEAPVAAINNSSSYTDSNSNSPQPLSQPQLDRNKRIKMEEENV